MGVRRETEYVLFDLDQTIVPWDTQLLFRNHVLQQEGWRRVLTLVFLLFTPLAKVLGTGTMKRIFHCYLWGLKKERLEELAADFVQTWLPRVTYGEILEEIIEYRKAGKTLVLSSASPELWVKLIGKRLGFDRSFGTRVDWGEKVPFFPDLIGENHKGEEKVRRFHKEGITHGIAGYSDSRADLPLLEMCARKTLVNPLARIRAVGEERGWRILEPEKPWKNRLEFGWGCFLQLWGLYRG